MKYNKIVLLGMMGSGKSSVSLKLCDKLKIQTFELDKIFEEKFKITIKEYFKNFSEESFRKEESVILNEFLKKDEYILSTGGGVILLPENRKILFEDDKILTIYLEASSNTIYERIKDDTSRPLLLVQNPKLEIEKIINKRKEYYELSKLKIKTDNKTVEEIADEICKQII